MSNPKVKGIASALAPLVRMRALAAWAALAALAALSACTTPVVHSPEDQASTACGKAPDIKAEIVAFEQAYVLNRFGAYVPAGMMYALRGDVVALDAQKPIGPGNVKLREDKRPRPLVLRVNEGDCLQVTLHNWMQPEWTEVGGQPPQPTLTLAAPDGRTVAAAPAHLVDPPGSATSRALKTLAATDRDAPRTRAVSFFVTGLEVGRPADCPVNAVCGGDGTYVGLDGHQGTFFHRDTTAAVRASYRSGSVIQPGQVSVSRWRAKQEGTYFAHSMGAPVGGEGDGGQIGLGLFAAVNVEPAESLWYRSQVTKEVLDRVQAVDPSKQHPYAAIDYDAKAGTQPVLAMLDEHRNIVHSDLNAIIVRKASQRDACNKRLQGNTADGQRCEPAFREFTVILHDEVHAVQAFPELEDESNPLHYVKDGMGVNYGVAGMGSLAYAAKPQRGVGPAAKCAECRAEEFFLSSWASGDPALILAWDGRDPQGRRDTQRPSGAKYPDDPSNVHHSYLGDPVVFRNLHAGPKETHVFHLHAHQWVLDASDPNSTYLDSQTISPGATFSYGIEFGGSGNRNYTVGDSIFHCHLYPHFAQGMWELWRVHDVFENGLHRGQFDPTKPIDEQRNNPLSRSLPDAEVQHGIASPAVVPLPGLALAPMASAAFRGYPFFIPGEPGHRPPQPVLDMDVADPAYVDYTQEPPDTSRIVNGGLPRHVLVDGNGLSPQQGGSLKALNALPSSEPEYQRVLERAMSKGGDAAQLIARKVNADTTMAFLPLAAEWDQLYLKLLPHSGTPSERQAMKFHEGELTDGGLRRAEVPSSLAGGPAGSAASQDDNWGKSTKGYRTEFAQTVAGMAKPQGEPVFRVNGGGRQPGAPYANPCPPGAPQRNYRAAFIQTEMTVNRHGWFDAQGRMVILEDDIKDVIDANQRTKLPEPLFFRANSGDCINFKSTNLVPSALNADDFQIYTPTDTIGQHIHLVKFDVTSSDGSGNGFNYEDSTFSPDEVRERIFANNRTPGHPQRLAPKSHPLFAPGGSIHSAAQLDPAFKGLLDKGSCPPQGQLSDEAYEALLDKKHPYCGAQRSTQRWWADPILVRGGPNDGKDNTLRTVFTHDHMGPSSHQQHGLYAALVIEPANSVWRFDSGLKPIGANQRAEDACNELMRHAKVAAQCPAPAEPAATSADPREQQLRLAMDLKCGLATGVTSLQSNDIDRLHKLADRCLADKQMGGADIAAKYTEGPLQATAPLQRLKPRPPWLHPDRSDGGPTATRAVIVSPTCVNEPDSNPYLAGSKQSCAQGEAAQTRREFALAFADFAGVYNLALEPINPETRDVSMRRFGERQVAPRQARPLAISSEDPGTQLINYRHEPIALRIAEIKFNPALGGFDYSQSARRASTPTDRCAAGDRDCLGDMANAFSSAVHEARDRQLASSTYLQWLRSQGGPVPSNELGLVSPAMSAKLGAKYSAALAKVVQDAEAWRQDFNCALYADEQWRPANGKYDKSSDLEAYQALCASRTAKRGGKAMTTTEPWRVFGDPATPILAAHEGDPVQVRLIQGAQEAQHVFAMTGLKWHRIPDSLNSGFVNAQPLGISEHFEFDFRVPRLDLPHADYLYYGSSIDQLWDGMWGLLRSYCKPGVDDKQCRGMPYQPDPRVPARHLTDVPRALATDTNANVQAELGACLSGRKEGKKFPVSSFDVSATEVCTLFGNCGSAGAGAVYSARYGITDPHALVYVLNSESTCQRDDGDLTTRGCHDATLPDNGQTLARLQSDFRSGQRRIEPLVLRAPSGACITVHLRNHLIASPAGPQPQANAEPMLAEADAAYNFLPMITDGFNLNQFAMSRSVGLSAPRVAQNAVIAGGSNLGLNGTMSASGSTGHQALHEMGSLVPPCRAGAQGNDAKACRRDLVWSATDLLQSVDAQQQRVITNEAVEFGALPLTSFGDAVKHPVHGLIGALVIGPEGSTVNDGRALPDGRPYPGGVSRRVCAPGNKCHGDHVLVMQDAVSAVRGGFPVPDLKGAEEPDDYGVKAINYKTEPLWARRGGSPSVDFSERGTNFDYTTVFSSKREGQGCEAGMPPNGQGPLACDPETPVIEADAGDDLRLHFVHSGGHTRQQGLTLSGHGFNPFAWEKNSHVFSPYRCDGAATSTLPGQHRGCSLWQGVFNGFGPMMGITLGMKAGGPDKVAKDYLIRSQASFLLDGGLWGILRVKPALTTSTR